jgi:hypothetical protein
MAMSGSEVDTLAAKGIAETLHFESRHYVAPIWWGTDPRDAATVLHNATCFFIQIGTSRFGVTAAHVVTTLSDDLRRHQGVFLMIRNTSLDRWEERLIDHDPVLDVATFRVSEAEFASIAVRPLVANADGWPPPPPQVGQGLAFTGYPGADRRVMGKRLVEFLQSSNLVVLRALSADDLEITIDPEFLQSLDGSPIPSTTKDLGGFSGSPLLIISAKSLSPLFSLGGVVFRQLVAKDDNDTTTVWARRANCIQANGTLIRL